MLLFSFASLDYKRDVNSQGEIPHMHESLWLQLHLTVP
jgi:hypothetical protein